MPLERSVLFAALWLTEQGRWGLKHPVQQEIYGFLGFKLHLWSRFMDIFQWCYCKGVATAALELMQTGQSKSAQPCTGIFQGPSRKHRPGPLCASSVAPCWVQFSPAQGLPSPFLQAKLAKLPSKLAFSEIQGTYMLQLKGWQKHSKRAANCMLMPWPIA